MYMTQQKCLQFVDKIGGYDEETNGGWGWGGGEIEVGYNC